MPECVSFRLYLLLDAWENFDIALDLRSLAISNFPTHLEVKYSRKETHTDIIFYMYCIELFKGTVHHSVNFNDYRIHLYCTYTNFN